jgi:aminoglycoside/choline kinase family phosphotransferase
VSSRPVPESLLPWALSILGLSECEAEPSMTGVAGDASSRRYFRFETAGQSYVLAEAPPATEKNEAFLAVRVLLAEAGVRVPDLLGADLDRGYLLLEDLGDRLLLPALDAVSVGEHYNRAFDVMLKMGLVDTQRAGLGEYNQKLLEEELGRFQQWFVEGLLGVAPTTREQSLIGDVSKRLIESALEQPRVLVHRDFHSRNLMLVGANDLAVIDFQDAVVGPVTYDLASLLRDCYIQWPVERVQQWARDYYGLLRSRGLLDEVDQGEFLRWFDWMGLQRHLKVLGTFARLYLRDGKSAYLEDLPLVIEYVLEILDKYAGEEPSFAELSAWFAAHLSPVIARQDWSR